MDYEMKKILCDDFGYTMDKLNSMNEDDLWDLWENCTTNYIPDEYMW